jgi:hypothetical protein
MTNCEKLKENLQPFVAERLPQSDLRQLEDHVEQCEACRGLLERELHAPLVELLTHDLLAHAAEPRRAPPTACPPRTLFTGAVCQFVLRPATTAGLRAVADASCKAPPPEVELTDDEGNLYLLYRQHDGNYVLHALSGCPPELPPACGEGPSWPSALTRRDCPWFRRSAWPACGSTLARASACGR